MCACVINTAFRERGSKGGSCQLRSRSSFKPWNRPQSTSTRDLPVSSKYFEPVTVPTPPQNEMLAKQKLLLNLWMFLRCETHDLLRRVFHAVRHSEIHPGLANHT